KDPYKLRNAAQAGAGLDDGIERGIGFAIGKVNPAIGVSGIEAVMLKNGAAKLALDRADPELAPPVEPSDNSGGAAAKSTLAIHENNRPAVIEMRDRGFRTIGVSLAMDRRHGLPWMDPPVLPSCQSNRYRQLALSPRR